MVTSDKANKCKSGIKEMIDDKFKSKNVISIFLGKTSYKEEIYTKK